MKMKRRRALEVICRNFDSLPQDVQELKTGASNVPRQLKKIPLT
ncbi:hypothetical protein IC582_019060 [Cucumis melo]